MACDSDTDETINLSSNDAIGSSSTVIVYGFIVFTNYYSPAYPKGNPAILNDAILGIDEAQAVAEYIPGHLLHHHVGHRPWGHIGNAGGVVVLPLGGPSAVLVDNDHDHDAALDDDNAADRTADMSGAHRPDGRGWPLTLISQPRHPATAV